MCSEQCVSDTQILVTDKHYYYFSPASNIATGETTLLVVGVPYLRHLCQCNPTPVLGLEKYRQQALV